MITTEKKIIANRANAQASTGPRTHRGKARASKNALRHGLSLPVLADQAQSAEIEELAQAIAAKAADHRAIDSARKIAEAHIDLVRIRLAQRMLCSQTLSDADTAGTDITEVARIKMLVAMDRYERRAFSRRKRAIRSFDALRGLREF